jgi:hypothetical protein
VTADAPFSPASESADTAPLSRWRRFRLAVVTPQSIYGTLLVSAIIGAAAPDATDRDVLITTIGTVLVFWVAHVFAEAIAHYGTQKAIGLPILVSLKHSLRSAAGLLYAALVPCVFLLLGALGIMDESLAYTISLWIPVFLLGALGWFAFADRGSVWWVRLLGSIVTGLLGLFVILLKITLH